MFGLLRLIILAGFVFWVLPTAWSHLSPADRMQLMQKGGEVIRAANALGESVMALYQNASDQTARGHAPVIQTQNSSLMLPGMWSMTANMNVRGQTMSQTGAKCYTPEEVANITSGGGLVDLMGPNRGNCQIRQGREGTQVSASGQCFIGGMTMEMYIQINLDTPRHFVGQMTQGMAGQAPMISATVEASWTGPC
jgi:hypothetical protein